MYELALFAGGGGGLLASKYLLGWRTVCYVEYAEFPVEVLKARIRDGLLDDAPIWDDVRTFRRDNPECGDFIGALAEIDNLAVTAGFPCTPFNAAGKQLGANDPGNRWPDTLRIIGEVRPRRVLLENSPMLLAFSRAKQRRAYTEQIFGELAEVGYDARWDCIPAAAVGANHERDRVWIVVADAHRA